MYRSFERSTCHLAATPSRALSAISDWLHVLFSASV
jgi:hypothetical protein